MNFHSKNESTKTQVSETFFWKKKKKQEVLLCGKEKGKNAVYGNCHLQYHQLFTQCSDNL